MIKKSSDFVSRQRAGKPLHVVLDEDLHGGAMDRTRALNRHAHPATDGHVGAENYWISRRIGDWVNGRRRPFSGSPFRRLLSLHYRLKTAGCQSGFFRLPVPAYSKSL